MIRYVNLNSCSVNKNQQLNKKNTKAVPISLLSGGNSFFVKIKSNQIASNYNDTSNKIKPNPFQKIKNTYFQKDNKNKSFNKYLNNTQHKNSYIFAVNNSIEYTNNNNNKKALINKSKQDLFNHNKGIYSFTSIKHNENMNNKTLNSTSFRQNYNGVLLTDVELLKKNINKKYNIYEDKQEKKKLMLRNDKYNNNTLNHRANKKVVNSKNKSNDHIISESSINKKMKNIKEKNTILTTINKSIYANNNQMKMYKKNQYIIKNSNKKNLKNRNLTNIIFNNNTNIEKSKPKNSNKNNCSEGKNKVIFHGTKKNKLVCYNEFNNNNNNKKNTNTNLFKDHFVETDEFNSSLSKRKAEKRIKSINIKPNNEALRIQKNNNSKSNFNNFNTINNNKPLVIQKKIYEKNNNAQHVINKSYNISSKNSNLINSLASGEIFKLNYTLNELMGPGSNYSKNKVNKQIYYNKEQKDIKNGNKFISGLTSFNLDKINNYPNIIINNNYLYNYIPLVTLNNSADDDKIQKISLNRNSFADNKLDNKINSSQNIEFDNNYNNYAYILNYNSFLDNNSNNLNKTNIDNKSKINKKYKNDPQIKINLNDNIKINKNNNKNNIIYNYNPTFINSNALDINKTNRNDFNLFPTNRANTNNIAECYVSKEKNKKQKQNPPLSKNPKKLNILSLIQENNRKIKDYNIRRQRQFHSFVETDNFNKSYNNKNVYETIDYILYPENYKIKDSIDVLDNFDDMNTIIKRIKFENVDLKSNNIFTVNDDKGSGTKTDKNFLYTKYSEKFDKLFDKKFLNKNNNMSATQNKYKNNSNLYHSRQSGSTKDSNKQNSSSKRYRVFSYLEKPIEKK